MARRREGIGRRSLRGWFGLQRTYLNGRCKSSLFNFFHAVYYLTRMPNRLFHPKQKRKRGDATGTRSEKHSAKRIQNMFEPETESQSTAYASKSTNVDRPGVIAMTEFQIAQLDEWVS